MILAKLIYLSLALQIVSDQSNITFFSGGNRVILTNFRPKSFEGIKSGEKQKHVDIVGDPAQLRSPEKGFTARGREMEFTWAELDPKTMEFRQGRIEGAATIIFDSDVAQKALTDDALNQKKKPPAPPAESSFMQVDSELFTYAGTVERGTLTMPDPWTFKDVAKGSQIQVKEKVPVKVNYDQTFDATGSKGVINIVRGPDGNLGKLESGTLEGPVHFKIVRRETPDGTSITTTTTYTGVADHIDIDLTTKPGTITAHGHVIVDADSIEYQAHFVEEDFVFLVSDKLEPIGLKFSGNPGKTKATAKDGIH